MNEISPHRFYSTQELHEILRGRISLAELRKSGLRGCPGKDYWGQNVIDAISRYLAQGEKNQLHVEQEQPPKRRNKRHQGSRDHEAQVNDTEALRRSFIQDRH